jgi:hypothetical protein
MPQPTIYVNIDSNYPNNPMKSAINMIASAAGAVPVDILVDSNEVEAGVAVVDSVSKALLLTKETERTVIVIAYVSREDSATNEAFACRYPGRVHACHYFGQGPHDVKSFAPFLMDLITDMKQE